MTSRDVVNVVQRRLPRKTKVGHAGTLDPLAEGVLVLGVGPAVRLVPYVQQQPKHYQATFRLAASSISGDLEGDITEHTDLPVPTREQLEDAAAGLTGHIEQTPPAHSAIWVDGRRAYQRIREGEEFEMPTRMVDVYSFGVTRYEFPEVDLDIVCGSGTYIRSLGIDLASAAGSRSVMSSLVRVGIGPFVLSDAVSIDDLREREVESMLLPASLAIGQMQQMVVDNASSTRLGHGLCIEGPPVSKGEPVSKTQPRSKAGSAEDAGDSEATGDSETTGDSEVSEAAVLTESGLLRAIVRFKRGAWYPYRVFPLDESVSTEPIAADSESD